jgi:hypothetical protein
MSNDRLSSDNLYHFKSNLAVLKSIITNCFRHNCWTETLPYKKSDQENFIVCFCDIKIEDAAYHRQCYGDNAIVLTKEWGKRNGVSPVRYIHENSPGMTSNYISSKNRFRDIRIRADHHDDTVIMDYIIFSLLLDSKKLHFDSIDEDIRANPNLLIDMKSTETEFLKAFEILKSNNHDLPVTRFMRSLMNRIYELHNEVEKRDSFMRVYNEDFTHPATKKTILNKILYDEKEWRSIKYPSGLEFSEAVKNKFLPEKYNLKFNDDDVLAILLKDKETVDEMIDFIKSNKTQLDPALSADKFHIINTYEEK